MGRLLYLGCVATAVTFVAAGCDIDQTATPTTIGAVESGPSTSDLSHSTISKLIDRITGHTISHRMELESPSLVGVWTILERDGEIIEAEYVGDAELHADQPWLSLSEALHLAIGADETVVIADQQPATSITLKVDIDVDAIDDEFEFSASDITILP